MSNEVVSSVGNPGKMCRDIMAHTEERSDGLDRLLSEVKNYNYSRTLNQVAFPGRVVCRC